MILRHALYEVFSAIAAGSSPASRAVATLNDSLVRALARLRLVAETPGQLGWTWAEDPTALDRPLWPIVRDASDLLTGNERGRVRTCAWPGCDRLFVDRSRNHSRRWREMAHCGMLAKSRRHYARTRGSPVGVARAVRCQPRPADRAGQGISMNDTLALRGPGRAAETLCTTRCWLAVLLLRAGQFMDVLDFSIVNIALPAIGRDLRFSLADLPWVVNAYTLILGGFVLLGGAVADLIGRRGTFMAGLALATLAALVGGLLARLPAAAAYLVDVLPATLMLAIGISITFTSATAGALSGVGADEQRVASGVLNTAIRTHLPHHRLSADQLATAGRRRVRAGRRPAGRRTRRTRRADASTWGACGAD